MTATIERVRPIEGPEPLTPEWFAMRERTIGSSEAAKAVGLSEYGTPLQLFAEKCGLIERFAGNKHTRRGRRYEPLVAEDWQELTGRTLRRYPAPLFVHPQHKWMTCTPDGIIDDDEGLEIKCPTWRQAHKFGEEGSDWLPSDYVIQAQHQMAVMGWARVHFAVLFDTSEDPRQFCVERNDKLIDGMIVAERALLDAIESNTPPEPDWQHDRTPDLIREMFGLEEGKTIVLGEDVAALWQQQRDLAEQIKDLTSQRETLRTKVLHAIGDAAIAACPGFDFELTRSVVKESQVSYLRQSYIQIRERKPQKAKRR